MTTYPQPVVPQFPAGYGPLPADFNNWVPTTFGGVATGTVFRGTRTGAQSLGAGFTVVQFGVLEDPWNGWNFSNSSWLAPWTGLYEVTVTVCIAAAARVIEACVLVSGNRLYEIGSWTTPAGFTGGVSGSVLVPLVGGLDYVQGEAWCSAASTAASGSAGVLSSMEISFVSQ